MKEPLFRIKIITNNIEKWIETFISECNLITINALPFGGREIITKLFYVSIENIQKCYMADNYSYNILIIDDENIDFIKEEDTEEYYSIPQIIVWNKDNFE